MVDIPKGLPPEDGSGGSSTTKLEGLARSLVTSMESLRGEYKLLRTEMVADRKDSRNRDLWLAFSVFLDVILTVVVTIFAVQANHASDKASKATSVAAESLRTQKITCEAGNDSRKGARELWTYVLEFSAKNNPNQTDAEKSQAETFRRYVNTVYADHDCNDLEKKP